MKIIEIFLKLLLLSGLVWITSCGGDDEGDCIKGSSTIITEPRDVSSFHSISAEIVGNILITQGSTQSLEIRTHDNIIGRVETTVVNNELLVTLDGCFEELDNFDVIVTIPEIKSITLNGVGNIIGQNDFDTDNLIITTNGVGNVSISGQTNILELTISGVGNVNAFEMTADICNIVISGSGNAEVTVAETLNVTISGSGNVFYKGDPDVSSTISGTGSVIDANE